VAHTDFAVRGDFNTYVIEVFEPFKSLLYNNKKIAAGRFELPTSRLWASRELQAPPRCYANRDKKGLKKVTFFGGL